MKRREFLNIGAAATLLGASPVKFGYAQSVATGPYFLGIEAFGGWDPTSFCDPKGRGLGPNGDINDYNSADISSVGNFAIAPPPDSFAGGGGLFTNQEFFTNHFQRLVVVNGIDVGTNSHDVGRTAAWTGSRTRNYPAIGALVGAENGAGLAMPFVSASTSQSSNTGGVVPRTVIRGNELNVLREIAFSNRSNVFDTSSDRQYFDDNVLNMVQAASASRRQRQLAGQRLERVRAALTNFDTVRGVDDQALAGFVDGLNATSAPNSYVASRNDANNLFNQAQNAFAAFEAGAATSAQIALGTFDTHDDHDARHYPRLMDFLAAVDNIIQDAIARGFGDNLIIVMASDFGRTNKYNNDAGKDHWPHTSVMAWGAPAHIDGNRLVGGTDDNQVSQAVDSITLTPDPSGVVLTHEHVHQALRTKVGIASNANITTNFSLGVPTLPILG